MIEQRILVDTGKQEIILRKVPASLLTTNDEFLRYRPRFSEEWHLFGWIQKAIYDGAKDFWRPIIDPSLLSTKGVCYQPGNMPAVGHSCQWWQEVAENLCPEWGSRLGNRWEYACFLGTLIKDLVEGGLPKERAWNLVCCHSEQLGHFMEYDDDDLQTTGQWNICGWCDLGNTYKILAKEQGVFIIGGGSWQEAHALADLRVDREGTTAKDEGVGWIVFDVDD